MTLWDGDAGHRELIEQQAFLRRLARRLVNDEHGAEDLVQDASVAALEGTPRTLVSMRSWLARVVRNRAANRARDDRLRTAREVEAASPDLPETPEEVARHLAVQRRVLEAVEGLEEPYKTTVYLRYYLDLGPTAIAERTGVPVSTVKTRLSRGLERLRVKLDEEHGGDRRVWAVCLAGTLGTGRDGALVGGALVGAAITGAKLVAVAAVLLLAWQVGAGLIERGEETAALEPVSLAGLPEAPILLASVEPADERVAIVVQEPETEATAPSWLLKLILDGLTDGKGEDVTIDVEYQKISLAKKTFTAKAARQVEVEVTSIFEEMRSDPPRRLSVTLDHPRYLPEKFGVNVPADAALPVRMETVVDLERPSGIVTGTVIAPESVEPARVRIDLIPMKGGRPENRSVDTAHADPDGHYRVRAGEATGYVVIAWIEGEPDVPGGSRRLAAMFRPETRTVEMIEGKCELAPIAFDRGARIQGRVDFPEGGAFDGKVELRLTPFGNYHGFLPGMTSLRWVDDRFAWQGFTIPWDESREFTIEGLEPATYRIKVEGAALHPRSSVRTIHSCWNDDPLQEVTATEEDLVLSVVQVRHRFLVTGDGVPIEGASFQLATRHVEPGRSGSNGTRTNEDGRVDVVTEKGRPLDIRVTHPGYVPRDVEISGENLEGEGTIEIELVEDEPRATVEIEAGEAGWPDGIVFQLALHDLEALGQTRAEIEKQRVSLSHSTRQAKYHLSRYPDDPVGIKIRAESEGMWVIDSIPAGSYFLRVLPRSWNPDEPCFYLHRPTTTSSSRATNCARSSGSPESAASCASSSPCSARGMASRSSCWIRRKPPSLAPTFWRKGPGVHDVSSGGGWLPPGLTNVSPAFPAGEYTLRVEAPNGPHDIPVTLEAGKVTRLEVDLDEL